MTEDKNSRKQNNSNKKKVILMFPGQGSQFIGMGSEFLNAKKDYTKYFDIAGDAFGDNLLNVINNKDGRGELLDKTQYSQIAIYSLSCALNDYLFNQTCFEKSSVKAVVGHSLGDYSALYSSGAFDFRQGAELVAYRGKLMADFAKSTLPSGQTDTENPNNITSVNDNISGIILPTDTEINSAPPENTGGPPNKMMMAAVIGSDFETIESVLKDFNRKVFIANYNDYSQIVISGMAEEVLKAGEEIKSKGAKRFIPLKVSIASHCPLMKEVSLSLGKYISGKFKEFPDLNFKFFSSTELSFIDKNRIKEALVSQLINPVRWVNAIEEILTDDVAALIEVGPGKVLSGLVKRIAAKLGREDIMIFNMDSLNEISNLKTYLEA